MKNNNQNSNKRTLIWLLIVLAVAACIKLFGNPGQNEPTGKSADDLETAATVESTELWEGSSPIEETETTVSNEGSSQSQKIPEDSAASLTFRNDKLLEEHYEKHGIEMGFDSPEAHEEAAAAVVANSDALYKTEAEDGDGVYYLEATNEFVIVSTDGYICTYFNPNDGINYFNGQ